MAGRKSYHDMILEETGIVSYWNFGAGSGSKAWDQKDTNHGTITGGTWTQKSNGIWMLDFDGNDYVSKTDTASLSVTGDMTIGAWIKPDDISGQKVIAGKYVSAGNQRSYAFLQDNDEISILINNLGTSPNTVRDSTNANLIAGQWVHVVVAYDASEGSATLYKDGDPLSDDGVALDTSIHDGTAPFRMGGIGGVGFFDGQINEVAIYNIVLSPETILKHFQVGVWEGLAEA